LSAGEASFEAVYLDGRSAARRRVRAVVAGGRLAVNGDGVACEFPLDEIAVERSISGDRCTLGLPDGAQLRSDDVAAIARAFGDSAREGLVHRLEGRWTAALLALALLVAGSLWTWKYGLPMAAALIAERMPTTLQDQVGGQALATLDRTVCNLSALTPDGQDAIQAATLQRILAGAPDADDYAMDFRSCPALGANAFALPAARILVTDELLKIADHDPDLIATVIAHEVGHVRHRHSLRMSLQATGVAILVATFMGDAVSITALAAALPALLLQTGYSREFEAEADDYALRRLTEMGIPPERFAEMLERLERSHAGRRGAATSNDYFSTHPATAARIAKARAYR
jgi:Zn-dependent protease with chaperone function